MFLLEFEKPIAALEERILDLKKLQKEVGQSESKNLESIEKLEGQLEDLIKATYGNLSRYDRVQLSRHPSRPTSFDYIKNLFEDITLCHGDRNFSEDASLICGFAKFQGKTIAFVGQQKGKNTKENMKRNFGMPRPEGYRKAARVFKLAERFEVPIFCFIDTPGAFPGIGAEERGQACAIAENLELLAGLSVPVLSLVIGEGGSGGALAIGLTNEIYMLEYSTYSVISPEGCASILWKDQGAVKSAAESLKLCSNDLFELGVVDKVIQEGGRGAHHFTKEVTSEIEKALRDFVKRFSKLSKSKVRENRFNKFRKIGVFSS